MLPLFDHQMQITLRMYACTSLHGILVSLVGSPLLTSTNTPSQCSGLVTTLLSLYKHDTQLLCAYVYKHLLLAGDCHAYKESLTVMCHVLTLKGGFGKASSEAAGNAPQMEGGKAYCCSSPI